MPLVQDDHLITRAPSPVRIWSTITRLNCSQEITPKLFSFNFMKGHLYGIPAAYYYADTMGLIILADLRQKYNAPRRLRRIAGPAGAFLEGDQG